MRELKELPANPPEYWDNEDEMVYDFTWVAFTDNSELEVECQISGVESELEIEITEFRTLNPDGVILTRSSQGSDHALEERLLFRNLVSFLRPLVIELWNLDRNDTLKAQRDFARENADL